MDYSALQAILHLPINPHPGVDYHVQDLANGGYRRLCSIESISITRGTGDAGFSRDGETESITRGGEPQPSSDVRHCTQGMYSIVHLMVYCPRFTGEMTYIENTVLKLLEDLGWDPEEPRVGAAVHFMGDPAFINAMTSVIHRRRLPFSSVRLPRDPELALEALDHSFKHVTHAVEFASRTNHTDSVTSTFAQTAWTHGVSYLKFALTL
jgi:hypothetical protein